MDRYQRAEKPREETPIRENEIRVTSQGRMRNYISYASILLQEKDADKIVFKAMGRAINKTVMIVELIKRRIVGLHQDTVIGSIDVTDTWEPLEEGLLPLETTRHVSIITITLSRKELDTSSVGYQPPLPADQVKPHVEVEYDGENSPGPRGRDHGGRGRGRGRGAGDSVLPLFRTRYNYFSTTFCNGPTVSPPVSGDGDAVNDYGRGGGRGAAGDGDVINDYGDASWDNRGRGYGRGGWGRSRGRGGFRGRGRGGYGGPEYYQPEGGDYDEAPAPTQGRGRARGRGQFRGRGREFRSNRPAAQDGGEET